MPSSKPGKSMVAAFIQARLTSTRFPGKVLADLNGKTVLERVQEAAEKIPGVDKVIVAWPVPDQGIEERDVLSRFKWYADVHKPDVIMRLTADCPLLDPQVCKLVLDRFFAYKATVPREWMYKGVVDYCSNVYPRRTFPDGLDCEVFSMEALEEACCRASTWYDREHVTPWMQANLRCAMVELPVDWSTVRLTVDTPEDLAWLRVAFSSPRSG